MISQISGDIGLYGERLAVVLGYITLGSALATLFSCRSCLTFLKRLKLARFLESGPYRFLYKYHAYYWWVFIVVLLLHLMTGLMHTAIPTRGDPDAAIHWYVLSFAFAAFISVGVVVSSCRSIASLINVFSGQSALENRGFAGFYGFHGYYWWVLIVAILGHLVSSYIHIGFWPNGI